MFPLYSTGSYIYRLNTSTISMSLNRRRSILSGYQLRTVWLSLFASLLPLMGASALAQAQSASIDFSAERNYVFENSTDGLLPFAIVINNPTANVLANVQLTISMPIGVRLGNVDKECPETADSGFRVLSCVVPSIKAFDSKVLDFFVDGPNSRSVGESFTLSITSSSIPVYEPDAFEASLADGDSHIRGSNFTVNLIRDIDLDIDRNGVPDIDESIMNLPAGTATADLLARKAVIDILFLYSPAAANYLDGKLESRIAQFLTATNQVFRENDVAIKFNGVGLAAVPYTATDVTLQTTLNAMQSHSDSAFDDASQLVRSSGGDLIVFLHALDPGVDTYCGYASANGIGRRGDFRTDYHQGNLISVINVGPDCLGVNDLSPLFASNMGIGTTRQEQPDGGTFSYSSGFAVTDAFTTLAAQLGTLSFGQVELLNRFSNPLALCQSIACGVDRNDLVQGADAVYSLNKTRHLVSAITPTVFAAEPDALPDRLTISSTANYAIDVLQTPVDAGALYNEFTEIQVSITNVSGQTLENLDVSFLHLNGGFFSLEPQLYLNSNSTCYVLGPNLSEVAIQAGDAEQKQGTLSCFIEALAPDESLNFSYQILIDATPPALNGDSYYHEIVAVNGIAQLESAMCLPVYANFVLANIGSSVCNNVQIQIPGLATGLPLDLNALPSVTGDMLALPFIRLWDGNLISAEFRITLKGPVELEMVSYAELDSALLPAYEANYDLANVLNIDNLQVDTAFYDIRATYVTDSNPVRFSGITATLLVPATP